MKLLVCLQKVINKANCFSFIPLIAIRLYLAPVFWMAGYNKWQHMENTIAWFGNPDWGLGLPMPWLMAHLASLTEMVGAVLLLIGFATRWISLPLIVTMLVAIFAVHLDQGWLAIAHESSPASATLNEVMQWLSQNAPQQYEALMKAGTPVMLNNGIEFATTYLILLLVLLCYGAGRYFSLDFWFARHYVLLPGQKKH